MAGYPVGAGIMASPPLIPPDYNFSSIQATDMSLYNFLELNNLIVNQITANTVTGLNPPLNNSDATNKQYVDDTINANINNVIWKNPVKLATTANISLSGFQTIDGYVTEVGDRVLVKNQGNSTQNGIYIVSSSSWQRSSDTSIGLQATGSFVFVYSGTTNGSLLYTCKTVSVLNEPVYYGLNGIIFTEFTSGGAGTPSLPLGSLQFNDNNIFTGSTSLTWSNTSGTLTVAGIVTGLLTPTNPSDAANKAYVDSQIGSNPGLPLNSVQFNDSNLFTGSSFFTWNNLTNLLSVENVSITGTRLSLNPTSGALVITGGLGVSDSIYLSNKLSISNGTSSGSPSISGARFESKSSYYNDNATSTNSTTPISVMNGFGTPYLTSTNLNVVTTDSATVYIQGAPVASTNMTLTNSYALWIDSGNSRFDGQLRIRDTTGSVSNSTGSLIVSGGVGISGDVHVASDVYANAFFTTSDLYLKTNVAPIYNSIETLKKIQCCSYEIFNHPEKNYGVIAQQLENIGLNNLVHNANGYKSVNYTQLIALIINSIQDISFELENIKNLQNLQINL